MKTIKQIREQYDTRFLSQVESLPEEIMLEGKDLSSRVPSSKEMPIMLIFRRVQYRVFPDKQYVAMYYSKTLNKYLTIPFGPKGNLNLSEAVLIDEEMLNEDWSDVKHQNPTGGLKKSGVMAYRRENPGSKLQTAVTTKPSKLKPGSKAANRRKSFCARMGGMKKRLTSAKTANDPDSRINKALRKWNCEESFRQKLYEKRMQQDEGVLSALDTGAEALVPYYSAGKKALKGDWSGAAKDAAVDTALMAATGGAGKLAVGAGKLALKGAGRGLTRAGIKVGGKTGGKIVRGAGRLAASAAKSAVKNAFTSDGKKQEPQQVQQVMPGERRHPKVKTFVASDLAKNRSGDITGSIESQALKKQARTSLQSPLKTSDVQENKVSDIRNMINENVDHMNLSINGRTVTLNNSMAKRIVEVYDSVNTKNKKIVEGMLNEDLESFKRLLNFSIKV